MRSLVCLVGVLLAGPAAAGMQTDVGVLTCTLAEHGTTDTNPDSQSRLMHCAFKPHGTGPEETYRGEIKKVGTQTALSGKRVLIWAVMGPPERKLTPAILEQTYVGKVAPDAGSPQPAKLLAGDRDDDYGLQPISEDPSEEQAAGTVTIVELRIKSSPG